MDKKKLAKIRVQLDGLYASAYGVKPATLISLATQLKRVRDTRGKEPTFVREIDPLAPPITIPNHKGKTLKLGTARSIVRQLLDDVDAWQQHLLLDETPTTREKLK